MAMLLHPARRRRAARVERRGERPSGSGHSRARGAGCAAMLFSSVMFFDIRILFLVPGTSSLIQADWLRIFRNATLSRCALSN